MREFLFNWQNLIGSIIGASAPLLIYFIIKTFEENRKYYEKLLYLEKVIVSYLNNIIDVKHNINQFLETKVLDLIKLIDKNNENNRATIGLAFLPLFACNSIDDNLLNIHTKSGYLDNKLAKILQLSKDFSLIIEDARCQFKETLELNKIIVINQLNNPALQNTLFKDNLISYKETLSQEIEKNVKIYINLLIEARVVLNKIRDNGIYRWHFKFSSSFHLFLNRKRFINYKNLTWERIDKYIQLDVEKQLQTIENNKP